MDLKSITIFILTIHLITPSGKIIKEETHGVSCSSWWEHNVEEKQFKLRQKICQILITFITEKLW